VNSFWITVGVLSILAISAVSGLAQEPKKISRPEAMAAAQSKVQPEYPAIARQLKVHGVAELEALVSEDGSVEKVNIVSGNPVLTKPAAEALKKWKFKPFTADGKPVKALASINFDFSIRGE
jgi:protein TonB